MAESDESSAHVAHVAVSGAAPSAEVLAAIVAAVEAVWPKPVAVEAPPVVPTTWRHAGRWWNEGRLPRTWAHKSF